MHGGGVGVREVDGPAATGVPDGARQVARTPEMPDDAVPLIVDLYPRTIVGCLGRPVADELEGCADRQARLAVVVHAPRVTAGSGALDRVKDLRSGYHLVVQEVSGEYLNAASAGPE